MADIVPMNKEQIKKYKAALDNVGAALEELEEMANDFEFKSLKLNKPLEQAIREENHAAYGNLTEGLTLGQTVYIIEVKHDKEECPKCKGSKQMDVTEPNSTNTFKVECNHCKGTGEIHSKKYVVEQRILHKIEITYSIGVIVSGETPKEYLKVKYMVHREGHIPYERKDIFTNRTDAAVALDEKLKKLAEEKNK
jgi:hypothetical protein